MELSKNDKGIIRSWAMFDWANSAYNLVITSTIFPAYYTIITTTKENGDKVVFFGREYVNTALANYSLAVAYLIMAALLPLLSSFADYRGNKKSFMKFFTYIGSLACAGLFFFKLETLELGVVLSSIAAIGYTGGVMFNNSYLPEIATVDQQDRVSAQGFAYGYIGSVLLQVICLVLVIKPDWFGIVDTSLSARISFLLVGIWWLSFAQIPFKALPEGNLSKGPFNYRKATSSYMELISVWKQLKHTKQLRQYLPAFFFYSTGVQTIMLVSASYGEKVLHLGTSKLIMTILVIQLVAIGGAFLVSKVAKHIGGIQVLLLLVVIWIFICVSAFFLKTETQFYVIATVVGLIMGGIQSLSRSTYSKFIPQGSPDTASFFSFYDVTEKLAIVLGLATFAFIEERTSIQNSPLGLSVFFLIAFFLLLRMLLNNCSALSKN